MDFWSSFLSVLCILFFWIFFFSSLRNRFCTIPPINARSVFHNYVFFLKNCKQTFQVVFVAYIYPLHASLRDGYSTFRIRLFLYSTISILFSSKWTYFAMNPNFRYSICSSSTALIRAARQESKVCIAGDKLTLIITRFAGTIRPRNYTSCEGRYHCYIVSSYVDNPFGASSYVCLINTLSWHIFADCMVGKWNGIQ